VIRLRRGKGMVLDPAIRIAQRRIVLHQPIVDDEIRRTSNRGWAADIRLAARRLTKPRPAG
jgi:hypothetical protein